MLNYGGKLSKMIINNHLGLGMEVPTEYALI
jgi:hypothetical protein